jgi:hypothetical protein
MAEALLVADHGQTLEIAAQPEKWYEKNPILGPYPSRGEVNAYFMAVEVLHPIVAWALPTEACIARWLPCDWRAAWQHVTIMVQAGSVNNNYQLGIGFGF